MEIKLVQRNDKVEVIKPKEYLSSKDVIQGIKNFESQIEKQAHEIEQMEKGIKNAKEVKSENEKHLKTIKKHEEWALKEQNKLLRNLVTKDLIEKTKIGFKLEDDPKFSEKEKKSLNYYRFKREVMSNEDIVDKVHLSVIEAESDKKDSALIPNHF